MGEGQVKTPKLTVLSKIQLFFLNKYSSNFRVTLVNLQVSEKVDFDNPYIFIAFMEESIFGGPSSTNPEMFL